MSEDSTVDLNLGVTVPPAPDEEHHSREPTPAAVLIVDDDDRLRESYRRILTGEGIGTLAVPSATQALELLRTGELFDVIVSDIVMPGIDGIEMLRKIRQHNLDVPIILVTGDPNLATAISAVQFGAFRYLVKPVPANSLISTVRDAIQLHRLARLKREALMLLSNTRELLGDRASLEAHFELALKRLWIAFQPIVGWQSREQLGYEALVRSAESRLCNPYLLFDAADRLGRLHELGRKIRQLIAESIAQAPADALIFVNIHPSDLDDENFISSEADLSEHAHRVVLEVTEHSSLERVTNLAQKAARLRALGYRMALDDFGAGYAGLVSFNSLEPDFVKLDMALIRNIEDSKRKQSLVQALISLCVRQLGIYVICEGVETINERETLVSLGANLMQGYLFARPAAGFSPAEFD